MAPTAPPGGPSRCWWAGPAPDYVAYHDDEWARPVIDDRRLLEKLCLEGFQAGLSWLTILRKRERFREAFDGFDAEVVARYGPADVERLLADAGIVRNRAKIEATIANARAALRTGPLSELAWSVPLGARAAPRTAADVPADTSESRALSRELKRRGYRFVGPTTAYAFLQATGVVNDHLADCWVRDACAAEQARARARLGGASADVAVSSPA